jgi:energy-coupling factor transporter ATP-binding protein EcfA2
MLAMARGLMADPKLLLIDEPSLGSLRSSAGNLRAACTPEAEGRTIVLVEQNTQRAVQVADQVYLMQGGRVVMAQAAADIDLDALPTAISRASTVRDPLTAGHAVGMWAPGCTCSTWQFEGVSFSGRVCPPIPSCREPRPCPDLNAGNNRAGGG